MAKNYLTRFATSPDANVLTDAELAAQPELASGFIAKSKASSKLIGKLIQNATAGSAALGEYIAAKTQQDVSATDADLGTKLTNAITAHIKAEAPKQDLSGYATKAELTNGLDEKAALQHTHTIQDVVMLQETLDAKLDASAAFTKAAADKLYLGKTAKAASAATADSATKATQDASGNVITATYATKAEVTSGLDGKLDKTAKAASAATADSATKATQDASGNVITSTYATKTELGTKAPLASPTFTGTVTAPTFKGALSGNATTATTATTANKTKAVLTLQMNGGSAQTFDGSTARTFNVTAAGIGALPTSGGTVSGSLTVNNALKAASITATSDIRLKNIINRYSTQSALYNLSAVDFSFKGSDDSVHTGLIAQEVQKLYPALVKEDERGYLSIDYCGVTALLVNDMKHLLNKISRLEQQIEAIKRDI